MGWGWRNIWELITLPVKYNFHLQYRKEFHLESVIWDCSKEGWKPLAIAEARACGKITHLKRNGIHTDCASHKLHIFKGFNLLPKLSL